MKKITNFEIGILSYFIIRSFFIFLSFNSLINNSYQDSYISIILSIIIGIIPLISIYIIFNYEPNLNLFEKFKKLFGKRIGTFINIIIIIFTFFLALTSFINLIAMINQTYLDNTPSIIITISVAFCIIYCLNKGLNTMIRSLIIFFMISFIMTIFSTLGLIFKIDLNNFKPVFNHNVIKGSFNFLSYNILPLYLLLLIPKNKIVNSVKTKKVVFLFYLIACFSLLFTTLSIIGTFGIKLTILYDYPEFEILKYVYVSGISSRLESVLFVSWILDIIIFIIYATFFCTKGILSIKPLKKNIVYTIFSVIFVLFNTKLINYFSLNTKLTNYLSYLSIIILVIIFISNIVLFFKKKNIKSNS